MGSQALTVGSLFAGIGGFDLGFERAGFTIRWQVERDAYCLQVLRKEWPDVRRFHDVRTVKGDDLGPADVVCGGFPCQPHSVAGRRDGAADDRDLWPEFRRIICELRPRWVVAENVVGLLSVDAGRFYGGLLGDLAESGYRVEWDCLPAAAFGAHHRRDRIWIVANACEPRLEGHARHGDDRHEPGWFDTESDGSTGARGLQPHDVADADGGRCSELRSSQQRDEQSASGHQPGRRRFDGRFFNVAPSGVWTPEPNVGRMADGIPRRMDRLRTLGNAVVPQIAEWIARRILETEAAEAAAEAR